MKRKRAPSHYNPPPMFGLRRSWVRYVPPPPISPRAYRDEGEVTRRFQRFLGGAHVQIDGWGYP